MASSSSSAEPSLDLGSPRTKAAMQVLGVTEADLEPVDPKAFEGREGRYKLFLQKRLNLIEEVKTKMSMSPDISGGKRSLEGGGLSREEKTNLFLQEVEEQERENMEKMQIMARKDVEKVVIAELSIKLTDHKGKKKQEESDQRMKEMLKLRDEQMAEKKKDATKRADRNKEVRRRAVMTMQDKNEDMTQALLAASQKAEASIKAHADQHQEHCVQMTEKRRQITERQDNYERGLLRDRKVAYTQHVAKHEAKLDKLAEALAQRQSDAQLVAERQRRSMESVRATLQKKAADEEERYWGVCARHDKAAEARRELAATETEFSIRSAKSKQSQLRSMERMKQETEENPGTKFTATYAPGSPEFVIKRAEARRASPGRGENPLARSQSDSRVFAVCEHRRDIGDVVYENKQRLRRAHHYMVEEQLDKLGNMRRRVEIMQEAKTEADKRRQTVVRNCSLEKMNLTERVDRIRDSKDPEKMYRMLEDLDPDQDSLDRINKYLKELGMEQMGNTMKEVA